MGNILLCGVSALEYDIRCGASPAEENAGSIMRHWIEKITGEKMVGGSGVIDLHIEAGDKLDNVKRSRLQWTYVSLMVRPDAEKARAFYKDVNRRKIYWKEEQHSLPDEQDYTKNPADWNFKKQ